MNMSNGMMGLIFIEAIMIFCLGGSVRHMQAQCATPRGCATLVEKSTMAGGPMRRAVYVCRTLTQCAAQPINTVLALKIAFSPSKLQVWQTWSDSQFFRVVLEKYCTYNYSKLAHIIPFFLPFMIYLPPLICFCAVRLREAAQILDFEAQLAKIRNIFVPPLLSSHHYLRGVQIQQCAWIISK